MLPGSHQAARIRTSVWTQIIDIVGERGGNRTYDPLIKRHRQWWLTSTLTRQIESLKQRVLLSFDGLTLCHFSETDSPLSTSYPPPIHLLSTSYPPPIHLLSTSYPPPIHLLST